MGKALDYHLREEIVSDYISGICYSHISLKYSVVRTTVKNLCERFEKQRKAGLTPRYSNCGKQKPDNNNFAFRASC